MVTPRADALTWCFSVVRAVDDVLAGQAGLTAREAKTSVRDRVQAVRYAYQRGLIPPPGTTIT
ncbi:hypothetical protein [Streptomyces scopuliridis]|uniref:hypothetical protein n=1 Tax=Streptomyces scopuliridis TaxID=452529 RepID=UPI00369E690A